MTVKFFAVNIDALSSIVPAESDNRSVSQFTLLASTKKGNKPDFHGALGGEEARSLYQCFYRKVQEGYSAEKVKDGVFQAMMDVALVNDGPVGAHLASWT